MIKFQKEYLKIIQQQNTKHIITEGIGIDGAFNFFVDLIPSTDSILGNSQEQAQTNVQGIMDKTIGKFATFSQPITNINTKGKKLQKNITKPYQAAGNGGNVDEEIQKSAEKSADWSQAVIVKEFQKKARSQGLKFKGLSSEALNSPQIINQKRKLILQYKKDLSNHIKKLIIQDAKKGITPNMWFDVNANPVDQRDIIFENTTISFKINNDILICEEIQNKSKKRHLISESFINKNTINENTQYGNYMMNKLGISKDTLREVGLLTNNGTLKRHFGKDSNGNSLGIQHWIANPENAKKIRGKISQAKLIELSDSYKANKKESDRLLANIAQPSSSNTPPATGDAGAPPATDAGTAGAADAAGTSIKDKLKLMWTKIKQGIDKFVRFIGKIVLAVISFIMTLMWFLIRLVIEGAKAVMKFFGKGSGGSFKGWNSCKADVNKLLGVNTALAERIAGYLSLVLVGGAIMVMTLSSSNSDTENVQTAKQLDMDLSLIADFQV